MKKLLTMTLAFVATTGWAQAKVNILDVAFDSKKETWLNAIQYMKMPGDK